MFTCDTKLGNLCFTRSKSKAKSNSVVEIRAAENRSIEAANWKRIPMFAGTDEEHFPTNFPSRTSLSGTTAPRFRVGGGQTAPQPQ